MAEIKLNDINSAMETFLKKADEVKLKKKDLMDNMPQLLQAIKMFDRLQELYNSVTDKDSPRAKNYFNLAQQIASINEGWQNAHQQVSREAFLADKEGAGFPNRLSKEESEQLKKLMQSSKLKDFVEFLDMESPQTYEKFKGIVLQEAESMVGTKVVQDALRDYYLATSSDISKSNLSLREWLSVKLADFIENINKDSEDDSDKSSGKKSVRASAEDETLVQDEEERQEKVKTDQAVAEIVKTSGKIDAALRKREPEKSKTKVKVKSKPWKAPKGTWMGDLMQLLKWGGYLAGGVAAMAAMLPGITKAINYFKETYKEGEEQKKVLFAKWDEVIERVKARQEEDLKRLSDKEAMERGMRERMKLFTQLPGVADFFGGNLSKDKVSALDAYMTKPKEERESLKSFFANTFGNLTGAQKKILTALINGDEIVDADLPFLRDKVRSGELGRTILTVPDRLLNPKTPEDYAQLGVLKAEYNRKAQLAQMAYLTPMDEDVFKNKDDSFEMRTRALVFNLIDKPGETISKLFSQRRAKNTNFANQFVGLPEGFLKMSPDEQARFLVENRSSDLWDRFSRYGISDEDPLSVIGSTDPGLQEYLLGETFERNRSAARKRYPNIVAAQEAGSFEAMQKALSQDSFLGKHEEFWQFQHPEVRDRIARELLRTQDMGSEEAYFQNVNERMGRQVGTIAPQTVVNNYSTTQFNSYEVTDKTQDGIN